MVASGLRRFDERVGDGAGQPRLDEEGGEELMHVQPGVAIALANQPPQSPGTLYMTTKRVIWLSDADKTRGYAVDFLSISLHAVSRDPEAYAVPCIYTQVDTEAGGDDESGDSDSECTELDPSKVTEMRLVPSDPSQLDALFDVFCECAELNPDPNEEGDEENDWVFGDEGMVVDNSGADSEWHFSEELANPIGHANGHHDLAHSVLELHINDQRFEDAEETDDKERARRQ